MLRQSKKLWKKETLQSIGLQNLFSPSQILFQVKISLTKENRQHIFKPFRPDFDSYFLSICRVLKERAGCIKEAVGAIIVRDKRIVATGYNGTPMGCANCFNGGCFVCGNS